MKSRRSPGPGEMIDVVATERGIAINPRRQDLLDAVKGSKLPIRPIEDIKAEVEQICGGKPSPSEAGRPSRAPSLSGSTARSSTPFGK